MKNVLFISALFSLALFNMSCDQDDDKGATLEILNVLPGEWQISDGGVILFNDKTSGTTKGATNFDASSSCTVPADGFQPFVFEVVESLQAGDERLYFTYTIPNCFLNASYHVRVVDENTITFEPGSVTEKTWNKVQ